MIEPTLADKFIKRAAQYTPYSINIMDENGIIIASTDPSRKGSFHEAAYHIMMADDDVVEVIHEDHFPGGRTGINMALFLHHKKAGVLGITGEPDDIREASKLLRMSLETILEYEEQSRQYYQQQNLLTRFTDGLLYSEAPDREQELAVLSGQLGYDASFMRIPFLIIIDQPEQARECLDRIRLRKLTNRQDICSVTRDREIMIFRAYRKEAAGGYRQDLEAMRESLTQILTAMNIKARFIAGTFQEKYGYYRDAYKHCAYLKGIKKTGIKETGIKGTGIKEKPSGYDGPETIDYFYDHVGGYMRSIAPVYELNRIYECIGPEITDQNNTRTIELIDALSRNNYNLNESSRDLFIHKNTLLFRFNKIKERYGINPVRSASDREFLDWLNQYLKMNR